jgi:hypothetical protein
VYDIYDIAKILYDNNIFRMFQVMDGTRIYFRGKEAPRKCAYEVTFKPFSFKFTGHSREFRTEGYILKIILFINVRYIFSVCKF